MKVFLNDTIAQSAYDRLSKYVEIVNTYDHPEELDAIIVRQQYCQREVIEKANQCKLIQQHGTGLDRIDLIAAKEYGIPVKNTPGVNACSVAEYTMMLMLACSKKVKYVDNKVQKGEITHFGMKETIGVEITGKKLGLVGSGNIAQNVARMAKYGFGMEVYCVSQHKSKEELEQMGFIKVETLETLFETCDYISLHNLLTEKTRHMINEDLLSHAKPGLIFVNTARGGLVDEKALYDALNSGKIAAAGLDVFEQEPPKIDNPLLSLENCIVSMHVAGSTKEAMEKNGNKVVDNVFEALHIKEI